MTYTLSHLYAGKNIYPTLISSYKYDMVVQPAVCVPTTCLRPHRRRSPGKVGPCRPLIERFLHNNLRSRAVKVKSLLVFVFYIEGKGLVGLLKNNLRRSFYVVSVVNVSKKISSAFAPIALDSLMLKYVSAGTNSGI